MNPPHSREDEIFKAALSLPSEQRAGYLNQTCGDDVQLRQRVEELLRTNQAGNLHEGNVPEKPDASGTMRISLPPEEKMGEKIGPYKIREKIGEGGCGVVYVADQEQPVRRRVALKVIKLGMDTHAVMARFEAERQALAMMDHPNIAKVLDAGATETGRPYFVMELVRGIKITDYCDQNKLSPKGRLNLFVQICQAIQHAHQKGIIHRDIKPSNILVTLHDGVPVPKVIDFGIAKATEGRLTDLTIYTELHQFIGTPAYMSPEQAEMSGLDIDTRSDIYSLGVLLYELLTGRTPFDAKELAESGLDAMRKTIREKEPLRPSTKLNTLQRDELTTMANRRGSDAPKLISLLRGDLDWIVMKCLEKDRTRRYETANGLAMDLKRHLNNEAVTARPPSAVYRFQKAFRRNKVAFTAGFAVTAALLLGIIATTLQSVRATHAKREALAAQAQEAVQRKNAEANEKKAVAAQKAEAEEELTARQRAYASDMNAAMQAFYDNDLGRALDLLNRQRPQPGQRDLRGWEWRYLWQQTRSDTLFTLCQQPAEVESLAVSSDGNFLAIGNEHKGGVSVWDLRTRQEIAHLAKSDTHARSAFSPAQPLLAFTSFTSFDAGQHKSTLHLWNTATRQMVAEIPLDGRCDGLAFSQDGKTLVTSSASPNGIIGGHIVLWRVSDGTKLASYDSQVEMLDPATGFAATGDLSLVAYNYGPPDPQKICVVDLRSGKELWTAVASPGFVTALAFSPDGKTLASADGFGESDIYLWDVATGKKIGQLEGHNGWVGSLVFWPDGKKLASASADQTIRVWDVASGKCLDVMRGNRSEVWRLALLPDNKTLVSGAKDGAVCFWDTSVTHSRQENITWPMKTVTATFTPDNSVLTLDANGEVARWTGTDFQEKEPLLEFGTLDNVMIEAGNYYFSKGGRLLAIGSTNGITSIWDTSRRILWRQLTNTANLVEPQEFLANGNKLITYSSSDNTLHEWDLTTGLEMQSWPMPPSFAGAAALSPDERFYVASGLEGDTISRNLVDESSVTLPLDILEVYSFAAAFSPDGKLLAIASNVNYTRVWDTKTWQEVVTLRGNGVNAVAFSPDGKRLAIGGDASSQALELWDTESWQNVATLRGSGNIFVPEFSLDGNSIRVLSRAGILHVWRAPSWAEIHATEKAQADNSSK